MRFSIRDLFLLTVIAGLAAGWWVDRSRLADDLRKERLAQLGRLMPGFRPAEMQLPNSQAPAPQAVTLGLFRARAGRIAGMKPKAKRQIGGFEALVNLALMVAITVDLYVLSSGPARAALPYQTWQIAYMPLSAMASLVPPFSEVWHWYVGLWA